MRKRGRTEIWVPFNQKEYEPGPGEYEPNSRRLHVGRAALAMVDKIDRLTAVSPPAPKPDKSREDMDEDLPEQATVS